MGSQGIRVHTLIGTLAVMVACDPGRERPVRDPVSSVMASLAHDDWSEPVNVGPPISSTFVDQSPTLSADGLSLYFSSNRPGTVGGKLAAIAWPLSSRPIWIGPPGPFTSASF